MTRVTIERLTTVNTVNADPVELDMVMRSGDREYRAFLLGLSGGWQVTVMATDGSILSASAAPGDTLEAVIAFATSAVANDAGSDWLPRCAA